jgi:pimeloyl-ACP methyl ester carboxylesterase
MPRISISKLLILFIGIIAFTFVGYTHFQATKGSEVIASLAILWIFVPAPAVYITSQILTFKQRFFRGMIRTYLAISFAMAALVLGGVSWTGANNAMSAKCTSEELEEAGEITDYPSLATRAEAVTFPSVHEYMLTGFFVPGGDDLQERPNTSVNNPTIAIINGYGSCYQEALAHADMFATAGYSVLLFDLRFQGESGGDSVTGGYYERGDVLGAIAYLGARRDVDSQNIGVFGLSMGGSLAILAAAEVPEIKAVIAESPYKSLRTAVYESFYYFVKLPAYPFGPIAVWIIEQTEDARADDVVPLSEVEKIAPRPVFIIHGERDLVIGAHNSQSIFDAAKQPKELWLVPGSGHSEAIKTAEEEYFHRVIGFFDEYLR